MSKYQEVQEKLNQFIRKFYLNELIKGALLFFAFGLLYLILIVLLEYFLWLNSLGRGILFFAFVAVELYLLVRFILFPILKWARISNGIDENKAAQIIGAHFSEVADRLTNLLQLQNELSQQQSEFLNAAIEQKAAQLSPVPFQLAINFKANVKYIPYALFPLLLIFGMWISGQIASFSDSYQRVVDYKTYYAPPAPFYFEILNENLQIEQGKSFTLQVNTQGDVSPDEVSLTFNEQAYLMKPSKDGFQYTFTQVTNPISFQLKGGGVRSQTYLLEVVDVPRVRNIALEIRPPRYTQLPNEEVVGSGNANFPEGSELVWKLTSSATDKVELAWLDSLYVFKANEDQFQLTKPIFKSGSYQILTSNANRTHYEQLSYRLQAIKDMPPKIEVEEKLDSLESVNYYRALLQDDYGLSKAQLVYYPTQEPENKQHKNIDIARATVADFFYEFPNAEINLAEGIAYTYYFEVFDNDTINGAKASRSKAFTYRKNTQNEDRDERLQRQSQSLQGMQQSLEKLKENQQDANEINQLSKEKNKLSFSDKKKIQSYIERQKQQREQMKKFTQDLKENLEKFQPDSKDPRKEDLQNRLEENEKRLQQNQDLLDELKEYQDKINEEDLKEKLDNISNENKKQERTLEQLLELTKRYYVEQKAQKIAEDLKDLSEQQDKLAKKESLPNEQKEVNERFESLQEELDKLEEENNNLKKPLDLFRDKFDEKDINRDLQKALDELNKSSNDSKEKDVESSDKIEDKDSESSPTSKEENEGESDGSESGESDGDGEDDASPSPSGKAKSAQKDAAEKMKEMAEKMGMQMSGSGMQQQAEDAESLRQILSNLVIFSFEQEALMIDFRNLSNDNPVFASKLRRQAELRDNFRHIDDSLYSLALRNQMITEQVITKITDIQYHTDLSLERLADNKVRMATSDQQYVMTFSNDLANMLDDSLDQMEMQMSGSGSGQGEGEGEDGNDPSEQLSDIIKSFEDLRKEMSSQGQSEGDSEGEEGGEGDQSEGGEDSDASQEGDDQSADGEGEDGDSEGENGEGQDGGEEGQSEDGKDGEGSYGDSEQMSERLYEIYKKQQALKDQLEDKIQELGLERDSRNLSKSLDMLERELLMYGFNEQVQKRMEEVKHQLLKLQQAAQKQGEDSKREANTNFEDFPASNSAEQNRAKEYFNSLEILNRQQLPLQPKYKPIIKTYFNDELLN